jgi:hypothetical protein
MTILEQIELQQQANQEAWQVMQDLQDIKRDLMRIHSFAAPMAKGDVLPTSLREKMSTITDACATLVDVQG